MPSRTVFYLCAATVLLISTACAKAQQSQASKLHEGLIALRTEAKVWMSNHEQALIEIFLNSTHKMLEWVSGYSTLWYSQFVDKYYAIEHDRTWHQTIAANLSALPNVELTLAAVDKGYKGWAGGDDGTREQFEEYISAVDRFGVDKFDRVLVDGRARADCAEYILPYLAPDAVVFIHDYVVRPYYHGVALKHYREIARVSDGQTLVVLKSRWQGDKTQ